MHYIKIIITLTGFAVLLPSCITPGLIKSTLQNEHTTAAQTLSKSNAKENPLSATHSPQNRLHDIEASLRELRGKIEITHAKSETELQDMELSLLALIHDLDTKISALLSVIETKKSKKKSSAKKNPDLSFFIAERLFQEKKWKEASLHYEEYRAIEKHGKYYRKATFQTAVCFKELNMEAEANKLFNEVVQNFPGTIEEKRAKSLLPSLSNEDPFVSPSSPGQSTIETSPTPIIPEQTTSTKEASSLTSQPKNPDEKTATPAHSTDKVSGENNTITSSENKDPAKKAGASPVAAPSLSP